MLQKQEELDRQIALVDVGCQANVSEESALSSSNNAHLLRSNIAQFDEKVAFRAKISELEEHQAQLKQELVEAVRRREMAEQQIDAASETVAALQRSRDIALLKEQEASLKVASFFVLFLNEATFFLA
jgi:septal ring factor EnvC (AmiA/AmiB activator)